MRVRLPNGVPSLLVAVLIAGAAGAPAAGAGRAPACAAGTLPADLATAVPAAAATERRRYRGPRPEAFSAALDAWPYGMPIVTLRRTADRFPADRLVGIGELAGPRTRTALYPAATADSRGRPLDGHHRYEVRFAAGQLPPRRRLLVTHAVRRRPQPRRQRLRALRAGGPHGDCATAPAGR